MPKASEPGVLTLVTGASGFLGSEIVKRARASGIPVRATGRGPDTSARYRRADIMDLPAIELAVTGADTIIHAAGLAHQFSAAAPSFDVVNRVGAANVARAAVSAGVRHFVLVSSVSVYGRHSEAANENAQCHPQGPYAISKLQAEREVGRLCSEHGIALTILRMATIYGEGDRGNMLRLIRSIDRNRFVSIGSGANLKSLIYKTDAADACLKALSSLPEQCERFNVSSPPCSMRAVLEEIHSALGKPLPGWFIPAKAACELARLFSWLTRRRGPLGSLLSTVDKWLADDSYDARKFEQVFRFSPATSLHDGIRREVHWYMGSGRS